VRTLSDEALLAEIRRQSAERRADPRRFVCEYLRLYWAYDGEEAARRDWTKLVEQYPWYADDVLACLDALIADPPEDLIDLLWRCGSIALGEQPDGRYVTPSFEEHVSWVRELRRELGEEYEAAGRNRSKS
jgi:hypothetical protein